MVSNLLQWLFKSFLKGLLIIVPLAVTAWVIFAVFTRIDGLVKFKTPGIGFLFTILIIVAVGALGSNIVANRAISFLEKYLNRVPLVKLIYFSLKDLIGAFVGEKKSFRIPVVVSLYPESGAKVLGFVTSEEPGLPGFSDHVAVYIPQSYIYSGFLMIVPRSQVTPLPPSESSKWMAFIVSGGVSRGLGGTAFEKPSEKNS